MYIGPGNNKRLAVVFALLCVSVLSLVGCTRNSGENHTIICDDYKHTSYPDLATKILPDYEMKIASNRAFYYLKTGAITEAFDPQAVSALESGVAAYWYPQYIATVVIAVDCDRTGVKISSWSDLSSAGLEVGIGNAFGSNPYVDNNMIMAAISYGLEGENFTLNKSAELLAGLHAENRLIRNSFDPPLVICYDFQAAELIKSGRNIKVVVPSEGTLTYKKGLLSKTELIFSGSVDDLLLAQGFRLIDGRSDAALYPDPAAYSNAAQVSDYARLITVSQDSTVIIRQDILRSRLLMSKDDRQHQYVALIYIIIVVMWLASVVHRTSQKSVRSAALLTGFILIGWMTVRLLRYQLPVANDLARYMWFSYYLFELTLPLVALWLAWAIDRPDNNSPPNWLRALAAISGVLVILVITNDLHGFVFHIDMSATHGTGDYTEEFGYTLTRIAYYAPMAAAIVMMLIKSASNPHKKGLVFPLVFFALMALYGYGYSARIPIAWESDITLITGLFTLMFFEAAMRTGMIPINTKYRSLFTHSPFSMQIVDNTNSTVLSSAFGFQHGNEENTLHFAAQIPGGTVLWQEDISAVNRLNAEIKESVRKLESANIVLAEEEKAKRSKHREIAKMQLLTQLENEIAEFMAKLSDMIENPKVSAGYNEHAQSILLLCYIKRRCNLFFLEKETENMRADELVVYIDELAEIAGYTGVKTTVTNTLSTELSVRRATLFYDIFYYVLNQSASLGCDNIMAYFGTERESTIMRLFPSVDLDSFHMDKKLEAAIASAGGGFIVKDLDDAFSISLSFPLGGESQ